jgi:L-ascorbate metabolism protein UlaG (beta-lactamase superfamily)
MELTKYIHSCVRITDGDRGLVIDPGGFSEVPVALDGIHAALVTHEHPDHIDVEAVTEAADSDPDLRIWAPASVAGMLAGLGDRVTTVTPGETFSAGGLEVRVFGGQHAQIHRSIPVVANLGYLVEDAVYHPGDSLDVPTAPVSTLLLPLHAPWSKTAEVLDFLIAVRPQQAYAIHDALLSEVGLGLVNGLLDRIATPYGPTYRRLVSGESVEV